MGALEDILGKETPAVVLWWDTNEYPQKHYWVGNIGQDQHTRSAILAILNEVIPDEHS